MATVKRYTFKRRPLYKRRRISRLATKKRKRRVIRSRFSTKNIPGTNLVGTTNCKIHRGLNLNFTSRNGRLLYHSNCFTNIPRTSPTDLLNTNTNSRERNVINLRGIKYFMHVRNNFDKPICFHYAIVVDRTPLKAPVIGDFNKDFFRNPGYNTGDRSRDFSTSVNGLDMAMMSINTDKFLVLKHKRIMIHQKLNGFGNYNPNMKNWVNISNYMPINRQIRYDIGVDGIHYAFTRIYLMYWADGLDTDTGTNIETGMFSAAINAESYFRESK